MNYQKRFACVLAAAAIATGAMCVQAESKSLLMNVHDYMEDYLKPTAKMVKKIQSTDALERALKQVPSMAATADDKAEWTAIVDKALESGDLEASCKECHKSYKKTYKKEHREALMPVSAELVDYLKTALK